MVLSDGNGLPMMRRDQQGTNVVMDMESYGGGSNDLAAHVPSCFWSFATTISSRCGPAIGAAQPVAANTATDGATGTKTCPAEWNEYA
jgi:hypothetical protein